jgi:uncharacterized membrane protein YphA (DoxX/SURF4 family)
MHDIAIPFPTLLVIRLAVAAVWFYEGFWNKLLGRGERQASVVAAVPGFGLRFAAPFLKVLGLVEVLIGFWVLSGIYPGDCALFQIGLLVLLNANGLLWARHIIHDPAGMVVKNAAFLLLAWVCGALPS